MYSYRKKRMGYTQSCTDKCSPISSQREQDLICSLCRFPGCKGLHCGQFQATNVMLLNAGWKEVCTVGPTCPAWYCVYLYTLLLLHTRGMRVCGIRAIFKVQALPISTSDLLCGQMGQSCGRKSTFCQKSISQGRTWGFLSCKIGGMTARGSPRMGWGDLWWLPFHYSHKPWGCKRV